MIIVLQGKPGSGKSTAANYLIRERGFVLHKIATPLKNMLRAGFGLTDEHIEGRLKREPCHALGGRTPVHAMRTLGGEWRDMMHPCLWLLAWEATRPDAERIVVDDNRYAQEVEYFRNLNEQVLFVRIERSSGEGDDNSQHMAENQQLDFDAQLGNAGTIARLERMLGTLVDQVAEVPCPYCKYRFQMLKKPYGHCNLCLGRGAVPESAAIEYSLLDLLNPTNLLDADGHSRSLGFGTFQDLLDDLRIRHSEEG